MYRGVLIPQLASCFYAQIWRDALRTKQQTPYMSHTLLDGALEGLGFCPYEDVMGIGHSAGITTILVPGAGEPNFDSYVANPFQNRRERQEQEVHMLLDKLQPETIVMDPDAIGRWAAGCFWGGALSLQCTGIGSNDISWFAVVLVIYAAREPSDCR